MKSLLAVLLLFPISGMGLQSDEVQKEWKHVESEYLRVRIERNSWESKFKELNSRRKTVEEQWHLVSNRWWAFQLEGRRQKLAEQRAQLETVRSQEIRVLENAIHATDHRLESERVKIEEDLTPGTAKYTGAIHLLSLEYEAQLFAVHDSDLVPAYERYTEGMAVYLDAVERAVKVAYMEDDDAVKTALLDLFEDYLQAIPKIAALVAGKR